MLRLLLISLSCCLFTVHAVVAQSRVALAGDSTVTDKAGWGAAFAKRLGPDARCLNFAQSGRSSKSFRDEGHWQKVLDAKPAFVLIQFGHNDMPGKGPARETNPATTFPENIGRCVDEARAIGAQPILVTPLARRTFENGGLAGELKPWAAATARVAAEKKVPLVDLFTLSVALHNNLGPVESDTFNPRGKHVDRTHLNTKGAEIIAEIIAEELRKVAPEMAKLLN